MPLPYNRPISIVAAAVVLTTYSAHYATFFFHAFVMYGWCL